MPKAQVSFPQAQISTVSQRSCHSNGAQAPFVTALALLQNENLEMATVCRKLTNRAQLVQIRCFAMAAGKGKKGGKGGGAGDAPKDTGLSKELKSTTVFGANILKEGSDPKLLAEAEYPDWLWHLIDKKPPLSELRRKDAQSLPFDDLKRFVKLDNRARIKENNSLRAKN